jgi:hypothetical protein
MKLVLIFFCLTFSNAFLAQVTVKKDSVFAKNITVFNSNYKEFEVVGNLVYAITKGDSLIQINLKNNKTSIVKNNIKSIAKNQQSKIIALTDKGKVLHQIRKKKFDVVDSFDGNAHKILVDKNNNHIIVTSKYVRYQNENFIPEDGSPMYRKAGRVGKSKTLIPIDVYYLDDENRVWFGYDAGEWGGDICFFDLNKKQLFSEDYIDTSVPNENYTEEKTDKWNPKIRWKTKAELLKDYPDKVKVIERDTILKFPSNLYISNIKGVTQNEKGDYYIATSMMHFSVRSGLSKKIKTDQKNFYKNIDISEVLEHKVYEEKKWEYIDNDGKIKETTSHPWKESFEYLGGITYNPYDKKVYYYTNNGFWKLIENENTYSKEFIFRPWINWTYGMEDAVGYQMNVTKFEFISEKELVFLTTNNGIGYFDGKSVKYFK